MRTHNIFVCEGIRKNRFILKKNGKRKVQGVPQSQIAALPRHKEGEETDKTNKHKSNKRTKCNKISSLSPKRGNGNAKRTEKKQTNKKKTKNKKKKKKQQYKNKITQGKTYNKSPCKINHKATNSKTNTGTTALEWSVE